MRKIIYLHLEKEKINQLILDECSRYSPLVEPRGEQEVLLDLSTFKRAGEIVKELAVFIYRQNAGPARLGLASNPLLAFCAACSSIPVQAKSKNTYRLQSYHNILILQVLPGQEASFLAGLPLQEFPVLSAKERQKLMRLGYSRVGEIAGLSRERLGQILKCDALLLWQNSRGIDYSPVRGIYPPDRLAGSILLPSCKDRQSLEQALQQISVSLEQELSQQHKACRKLVLEIQGEKESLIRERLLGYACYEASQLTRILAELLPESELPLPVEELRVYLDRLEKIEVEMPDLFIWHRHYQEEQRHRRLQEAINNLLQRFPWSIQQGAEVERREQVLALWDPWRFPSQDR
jgi:nucleotidyltransferase/DNA polymerase involved in DNA repair